MNRTTETHLKHGLNRIKKDVTPFLYTSMDRYIDWCFDEEDKRDLKNLWGE